MPTELWRHLAVDLATETDLIAMPSANTAPRPGARPESTICRISRPDTALGGTLDGVEKTTGVALHFPTRAADGRLPYGRLRAMLSERCGGAGDAEPDLPGLAANGYLTATSGNETGHATEEDILGASAWSPSATRRAPRSPQRLCHNGNPALEWCVGTYGQPWAT